MSDDLIFFVNGKKIVEKNPEPEASLLQYLRRSLLLPGTKEGCGHGGCGSCTVMVSRMDYENKQIKHYTVNACLFPLCAAHGLAITTVEGVGNPRTGLHDVQKRLIESHGLQCGFCTPGFVMSVFTLLRNNPSPTRDELETAIEGNLCRCTGYRPIVQAFNDLCQDACPQGDLCCKNQKYTDMLKEDTTNPNQSQNPEDTSQVAIFPAELQLSNKYSSSQMTFKGCNWTWFRPTTLDELLKLKNEYPDAPVIMGNTIAGLHLKLGKFKGRCLIYGGSVSALKTAELNGHGIVLGAGLTIQEMGAKLKDMESKIPEESRSHFSALYSMIRQYGADQIRNTATIGGSLMSGRSNSDITCILVGLRAFVNTQSVTTESAWYLHDLESLKSRMKGNDVITSIVIPFSKKNEYTMFYKQSDRRTFSLAHLNCCLSVGLSDDQQVRYVRMCFGGIGKHEVVKDITPDKDKGSGWFRNTIWDNELLENVLGHLPELLKTDEHQAEDKYKLSVAAGFFFKFYHHVKEQLENAKRVEFNGPSDPINKTEIEPVRGTQIYEPFTDPDQNDSDALHKPVPNVSSEAIVSGEAQYVDDIPQMAGELFIALVTSKRAHARILSVDASKALSLPGVRGFIDHSDIRGQNLMGTNFKDEEMFASEEVIFYGQPIGAIVAETREVARHAVWLVKIEYEDLQSILTIEGAIREKSFFDNKAEISAGDTEAGFQQSDETITGEYSTGYQEHFYLEPWSCLVVPRGDNGEMDISVGTHHLMAVQENVCRVLGVPRHKVSCSIKRLGGGFGGKQGRLSMIVGPSAVAAQKYGRPVRCVLSRESDMEITGKRHPFIGKYKVGVLKSGKIRALDIQMYVNAGNSLGVTGAIFNKVMSDFNGCYKLDNLQFNGTICKTNVPSNTAFRAFGSPEGLLIMEDIIFKIACSLGLSQQEVRMANLFHKGDITKYGIPLPNCSVIELWERCEQQSNFTQRQKEVDVFNRENRWKKRGLVITAERYIIGWPVKHLYQGTAVISIYLDGTVLLTHGGIEMGQGINTKLIQIASRELGIPKEMIYISDSNTKTAPNSVITAASMGTEIYAPAVMDACRIMNERLKPLREANPDKPWKELISLAFFNRVQLTATGFSRYPKDQYDPVTKTGTKADYFTYGAVCTEVEIDVLTGENQVLQTDIVLDVGKSLNPGIDIGQIEGAFVQGQGMVTSELIDVDENGKMLNCSPLNYKIPNVRCVPRKFNVTLVREDSIETPVYSAKAVGEPPLLLSISVLMAIKEAIKAARAEIGLSGYFRLDSPATVERIRMACGDQLGKQ